MQAAIHLEQAPAAPGRSVPAIAVLASAERIGDLKSVCADVQDLSAIPAPDVVMRHGGGLILVEQGQPGWTSCC